MEALILKAVDTFFFRDHRPHTGGEDNRAVGLFPPRPGTVYGALRSAFIHKYSNFQDFAASKHEQVKYWMGTPENIGAFSIQAVWLYDGKQPLLPLPLDYQLVKESDGVTAYPLVLVEEDGTFASDGAAWRLYGPVAKKSESAAGAVLSLEAWKAQLLKREPVRTNYLSQWIVREPKVGIARDESTKIAREHMLYRMSMLRFSPGADADQDPGLMVLLKQAPSFAEIPLLQLGGETRPWSIDHAKTQQFTLLTEHEESEVIEQVKETKRARIICLTPAIWDKGSRPACYNEETGELELEEDLRVKVLTAAVGRPVLVGGWDIARDRPKERYYVVPAGSVLYVEVEPEWAERFVRAVNRTPLTDRFAHEGYGYVVCAPSHDPKH